MKKEKDPSEMSTIEINEEIEACYEALNALEILRGMKMRLGQDLDKGILNRVKLLKEGLVMKK